MPDELAYRAQKNSHIQLDDDFEVRNWCRHLKVSRDELHQTITKVGNSASAVRNELARSLISKTDGVGIEQIKPDQL